MPTEFPHSPLEVDGTSSEERRAQRVALARWMAVSDFGLLRIARDCGMNPISLIRVLEGTTFATGPFPEGMDRKAYLTAWEARKERDKAKG